MLFPGYLEEPILDNFIKLIGINTGWHIRPQDRDAVGRKICTRMRILKIFVPDKYYQLLDSETQESQQEWQALAILLTTTESYLFRDKGQFSLLQNRILPELIERRKYAKSLRIWSAGCSTGEEAYSLAILVKQLITNLSAWDILILGTDINSEVIQKAKQGIYSTWSFRLVDSELQTQYFKLSKGEWYLDSEIRNMVKFQQGNLMKDQFPNFTNDLNNMDLILCRNVFLYFESTAIVSILNKIYKTLKPDGYFLTGHAEIQGLDIGNFQVKLFPESVVYQPQKTVPVNKNNILPETFSLSTPRLNIGNLFPKNIDSLDVSKPKIIEPIQKLNVPSISEHKLENTQETDSIFKEAQKLFKNKQYEQAIKKAKQLIVFQPQHFEAYYLIAQVYANLAEYTQAIRYCQKALAINSLAVEPYYLLAHISEEKGDIEKAKILFKKIMYIAPNSIAAYLELAFIYDQEGDIIRARKMRTVALQLLTEMPPSTPVDVSGKLTASALIDQVKEMLNNHP